MDHGTGKVRFVDAPFNSVEVFSATTMKDRAAVGDEVTQWMQHNSDCTVIEIAINQSSDAAFHCLSLTVFYDDPNL